MRTDEKLRTVYETIAPVITRSERDWKEYLDFAVNFYKYSFDNTLLVYAQNRDVSMLASTAIWNKVGRYVNKGSKGIGVCEYAKAKISIKYLFDVNQTHGQKVPDMKWIVAEADKGNFLEHLNYTHNIWADSFGECLADIIESVVADNMDTCLQEFENDIKGHMFETLPFDGLQRQMQDIIVDSVKYYIAERCSLTTDELRMGQGMATISHFNTIPLIARLGFTVTDISKGILKEVERTAGILNSLENERTQYATDKEKERSEAHGSNQTELYRESGRTSISESTDIKRDKGRHAASREIRTDGNELSSRQSSRTIYTFENGWNVNGEDAQSQQGSNREDGIDNTADVVETFNAGDRGHASESETFEQSKVGSRGSSSERNSVQSEIVNNNFDKSEEPPGSVKPLAGGSFDFADTSNPIYQEYTRKQVDDMLVKALTAEELYPPNYFSKMRELIDDNNISEAEIVDKLSEIYQSCGQIEGDLKVHYQITVDNEKTGLRIRMDKLVAKPDWKAIYSMISYLIENGLFPNPIEKPMKEKEVPLEEHIEDIIENHKDVTTERVSNSNVKMIDKEDGQLSFHDLIHSQEENEQSFVSNEIESEQIGKENKEDLTSNSLTYQIVNNETTTDMEEAIAVEDIHTINRSNIIETVLPKTKAVIQNFHYSEDMELYPKGDKSKYKNNIEAIKLLKKLEVDKRNATPEEQKVLAGYVGWGGLANAFNAEANGWEKEYLELKHLLEDREYKDAMQSTITAYYTEQKLIQFMYKTVESFGFNGGADRKLLDPAMGTGNFYSVIPESMKETKLYGVELDSITGRIAKQLYPKAEVQVRGFETADYPDGYFDVAIGNIPFNNIKIYDKRYDKEDFLIHDYFIAKTLDLVKPGGIIAFISTKGTMDKTDNSIREYIAKRADLLGAVRLPNTAFKALAGTEVTADILFLKKKEKVQHLSKGEMPDWVFTEVDKKNYIRMNQYFIEHKDMVLGEMKFSRNMYGSETQSACIAPDGQDLYEELERALRNISGTFSALPDEKIVKEYDTEEATKELIAAEPGMKNFTYVVKDESIYYIEKMMLQPQNITGNKAERIKGLCKLREELLKVIQIQTEEYHQEDLKSAQERLNKVYDAFVDTYGYVNSKSNIQTFSDDDQFPLLRSIEIENKNTKLFEKTAIFYKATIRSYHRPDYVDTAKEALEISLNLRMKVDIPHIAELTRKEEEEVITELGDRIYLNPQKYYGNQLEGWEVSEEYLSGEVQGKLAYARIKAEEYPELFRRNVEALEAVQPAPLLPADIDFRIGSPWIPIEYYEKFMHETLGTPEYLKRTITIDYLDYTTTWRVNAKSQEPTSVKVNQTFGTPRVNAYQIYEDSLNLQSTTVRDPVRYYDANGNEQIKYVINSKDTMIARSKQSQLKEAFHSWLFQEKERAEILLKIYNDRFNTIRPREYDGSHLMFQNMNETMELRPHQKNFAARVIYSGRGLAGHVVGAGKTAALIAAGMYLKQIGAIQKPIYVVPNHLTDQWGNEFLRFFPSANVLVTSKDDFNKQNRNRFVSRIAMGEYDAVIIGHSQFERIPISKERQEEMVNKQINQIEFAIQSAKKQNGDNWSIKQMVIFQKNLKMRLDKLANESKKDNLLTFEQLGVDYMFVDEAHNFKNCFTYSKMRNVAGIGKTSSQRAMDMLLKCQYLQEVNQGKGVIFATGTPISNSMTEMYVMMRYLEPEQLDRLGLTSFDSWAATFGEVVSSLEITPEGSGYRMKSRFAKFHNLPELMNIFRMVADIQTQDMLDLKVPEIKGGKAEIVVTECTPKQKEIMEEFVVRAEAIRNNEVDATEDNMLKLTNEAKLMSIDPRLIDEKAPNESTSKLNMAIDKAHEIWGRTKGDELTQLVFCDSGTPKPGHFNVYDEMKEQLIQKGIPDSEIAFIHDAKTDKQREDLFEKVREGSVRILLGSTGKLGTGTNVQDRLVALHHLDCPWRPSDIEQRDGRGIRQGNINEVVEIYRYVTKGSFDSYLWQIQEQKLKYITQVMNGKSISRSCEDMDETVLSAAEVKAIATSNPLLAEKMEVDNEVVRLKILKANWTNEHLSLERNARERFPRMIEKAEQSIEAIKEDLQLRNKTENDDFNIIIDGIKFDDRSKAGEFLMTTVSLLQLERNEMASIGEYRGFQLSVVKDSFSLMDLYVSGKHRYSFTMSDSGLGTLIKLDNLIGKLDKELEEQERKLQNTRTQLIEAKRELEKPFEYEAQLMEYTSRQTEIDLKLEFDDLNKGQNIIAQDGEIGTVPSNKQNEIEEEEEV